jgi:hypothetical protein
VKPGLLYLPNSAGYFRTIGFHEKIHPSVIIVIIGYPYPLIRKIKFQAHIQTIIL